MDDPRPELPEGYDWPAHFAPMVDAAEAFIAEQVGFHSPGMREQAIDFVCVMLDVPSVREAFAIKAATVEYFAAVRDARALAERSKQWGGAAGDAARDRWRAAFVAMEAAVGVRDSETTQGGES